MTKNYSTRLLARAWFQVYRDHGLSDDEAFFAAERELFGDVRYNPEEVDPEGLFYLLYEMVREGKSGYRKLLVDAKFHLKYGAGKN